MSATGLQLNPGEMVPGTKYRVVKSLGAGGMGIVYQVVKPPNIGGVLKLMSTELTAHQEHLTRFFDEVRILAQLDHPNIVKVFDYDKLADGTPYYVMELLTGRTVRDVIGMMGRVPPRVAYEVTRQLLEAMQAAHTHDVPVIHRDIKPENIFLHAPRHGEPVVKLIDFGVSAVADRKHDGAFVGTWSYAAPEQIRGEKPTPATDLYAAGLVLYEMLAGVGPFDHYEDWAQVSEAQIKEIPAPVSKFAPWVPPSIVQLIASALAKDPRQRPRDAYAFAESLFELEWASDGKDPHDLTIEGPSSPLEKAEKVEKEKAQPNLAAARPAAGRAFTPKRARPDTPLMHVGGKGPLSKVLSSVTTLERDLPSSKNLAAAKPAAADRLGDLPLIGVPPESVRSGPTARGLGEAKHEPTSPNADALLEGLGAEPRKPPSKRERESDPDVQKNGEAQQQQPNSPRPGQVIIRAGKHPSDPHEVRSPTTPRAGRVNALSDVLTREGVPAQPSPSHRDTFSSQQSDPHRGVVNRSKLPIILVAIALLMGGILIAAVLVIRTRATHIVNTNASGEVTATTTTPAPPATSAPPPPPSTTANIVADPIPTTSSVKPALVKTGSVKAPNTTAGSKIVPTAPATTPPGSSSTRPDFIRAPF